MGRVGVKVKSAATPTVAIGGKQDDEWFRKCKYDTSITWYLYVYTCIKYLLRGRSY